MQEWKTPGLSVVVIKNGKKVFSKGFGIEKFETRRRVRTETRFPIASLSKTLTSVLAAMLIEEGRLQWDEPVRQLLPDFRLQDPVATTRCTLKDLLSHRSGLGRRDGLWYRRGLDTQALLSRLPYLAPKEEFRDRFDYSNVGFALVGMIEEKAGGMSWETLLSRRLLQPLRMSMTTVPPPRDEKGVAVPHILGPHRSAEPIAPLNEPALAPALGLWSTTDDLENWLRFLLEPSHRGLITPDSLEALWVPVLPVPEVATPEMPMQAYGMGWMISSYRGRRLLFHTGRGAGSSSILALLPGENLGIVVLSNLSNSRAPEILAWRIVDLLLDLEPVDWKSRLWSQEDKLDQLKALQKEKILEAIESAELPGDTADRTGVYENPAYGRLEINSTGAGELSLQFRNFTAPLSVLKDRVYVARIKNDPLWKKLALEFLPRATSPGVVLRLDGDSIVFTKRKADRKGPPENLQQDEGLRPLDVAE